MRPMAWKPASSGCGSPSTRGRRCAFPPPKSPAVTAINRPDTTNVARVHDEHGARPRGGHDRALLDERAGDEPDVERGGQQTVGPGEGVDVHQVRDGPRPRRPERRADRRSPRRCRRRFQVARARTPCAPRGGAREFGDDHHPPAFRVIRRPQPDVGPRSPLTVTDALTAGWTSPTCPTSLARRSRRSARIWAACEPETETRRANVSRRIRAGRRQPIVAARATH